MYGGYEGGWNPGDYLTGDVGDFPTDRYQNKAGHDYLDFRQWALGKWTDASTRDQMLAKIYLSAKAIKFLPQMAKDLRKTYGFCQCSYESNVTRVQVQAQSEDESLQCCKEAYGSKQHRTENNGVSFQGKG